MRAAIMSFNWPMVSDGRHGMAVFVPRRSLTLTMIISWPAPTGAAAALFSLFSFFSFFSFLVASFAESFCGGNAAPSLSLPEP